MNVRSGRPGVRSIGSRPGVKISRRRPGIEATVGKSAYPLTESRRIAIMAGFVQIYFKVEK